MSDKKKRTIKSFLKSISLSEWIILCVAVILLLCCLGVFSWKQYFAIDSPVDHDIWGACGDFIGGVMGTLLSILSIVLVVRTFRYQQTVTEDNKKQLETQRFNDLFFELLGHYHRIVNNMTEVLSFHREEDDKITDEETTYQDKEVFDVKKRELQETFVESNSFRLNDRHALNLYMEYYVKNSSKLSPYFRVLYRMYNLIDKAKISEDDKKNYIKILRCQFSESELFFIRYNAMSYYGQKSVRYLNKYHILKHLPAFEMLEFKMYWKGLTDLERVGMNILFQHLSVKIREGLEYKSQKVTLEEDFIKYKYLISIHNGNSVTMRLVVDKLRKNRFRDFSALEKYSPNQLAGLMNAFLMELFVYSNFSRYNPGAVLLDPSISSKRNKVEITCRIITSGKFKLHDDFGDDDGAGINSI